MKGRMTHLKVEKAIGMDTPLCNRVYGCSFLNYDEKKECIYLKLVEDELCDVSLDVIYDCCVTGEKDITQVMARVVDRYHGIHGKTLVLKIVEGFYKIPINKVDK